MSSAGRCWARGGARFRAAHYLIAMVANNLPDLDIFLARLTSGRLGTYFIIVATRTLFSARFR